MFVRRASRQNRLLLTAIVFCTLILRFLVPNGWMPVMSASGWTLEICNGMEVPSMDMDHGAPMAGMHHGMDKHDHRAGDRPCVYSAVACALTGPIALGVDGLTLAPVEQLIVLVEAVAIGRGLAAPPPPATGPPAFS